MFFIVSFNYLLSSEIRRICSGLYWFWGRFALNSNLVLTAKSRDNTVRSRVKSHWLPTAIGSARVPASRFGALSLFIWVPVNYDVTLFCVCAALRYLHYSGIKVGITKECSLYDNKIRLCIAILFEPWRCKCLPCVLHFNAQQTFRCVF